MNHSDPKGLCALYNNRYMLIGKFWVLQYSYCVDDAFSGGGGGEGNGQVSLARCSVAAALAAVNVTGDVLLAGVLVRGAALAITGFAVGQVAARQLANGVTRNFGTQALGESYRLTAAAAALPYGAALGNAFKSNFVQVGIAEVARLGSSLWDFVPVAASINALRTAARECGPLLGR